jgi:hypothetical protein
LWGAEINLILDNAAGVRRTTVQAAMAQLREIFRVGGVDFRWSEAEGTEQDCRASPRIQAQVTTASPPRPLRSSIGYSLPLSSTGINVTIYQRAVNATALRHGVDPAVILAHALAHEIGHVLQRSKEHSPHGLMSAAWVDRDYDLMWRTPLRFNKQQIAAIKKTLRKESCQGDL